MTKPPTSLLYQDPEPLPTLPDTATVDDYRSYIDTLAARYGNSLITHRGLTEYVQQEYTLNQHFHSQVDRE